MIRSASLFFLAALLALTVFSCGTTPTAGTSKAPSASASNSTAPEKASTTTSRPAAVPAQSLAEPVKPSDILKGDLAAYSGASDAAAVLRAVDQNLLRRQLKPEQLSRNDQILYADLLLATQNFDRARGLFEQLLARDDKDRDALISLTMLSGDQPEKQRLYLNKLLANYPGDPAVKVLQGQVELTAGNKQAAQQAFEASLKTSDNAEALVGLAQIAQSAKKWDQALAYLNRAEKADPENDLVYAKRARVYSEKELYFDAEKDVNKALSLQPGNPWHSLDRARLYWLHMYKPVEALSDLSIVLEKDPDNFFAHVYRGEIYDSQNKAKEAWAEYQKVLALHSDYRAAYPPATILAFHFKNWDRAFALSQEAWKDYPGEYAFPIIAALSARAMGQPQQAKAIVEKAQVKFAQNATIAEMFRFLITPKNDYYLNDLLSKEKDKTTLCRLRFYQGCLYAIDKSQASARAAFQEVSNFTLNGVPEIRMSRDWLEGLN